MVFVKNRWSFELRSERIRSKMFTNISSLDNRLWIVLASLIFPSWKQLYKLHSSFPNNPASPFIPPEQPRNTNIVRATRPHTIILIQINSPFNKAPNKYPAEPIKTSKLSPRVSCTVIAHLRIWKWNIRIKIFELWSKTVPLD